jgi:autoinducer 2-degrading protein
MSMLALWVAVKVKPDKREQFLAAIEDDAICSERDEPGCVRFNVLQDQNDPNQYYFFEVYRDEAALEAHRAAPHYARWRAAAAEVVEGDTVRTNVTPVIPRPESGYWG